MGVAGFPLELERERRILADWNTRVKPEERLVIAEAAVLLVTLERLLRGAVGPRGKGKTLRTLLLQATDQKSGFLKIEGKEKAVKAAADLRNAIMHGDFEELAGEIPDDQLFEAILMVRKLVESFQTQLSEKSL